MLVFDEKWSAEKGQTTIPLTQAHEAEIRVSCTQPVQLFGLRGKKKVPLHCEAQFRTKIRTKGFDALILKGPTGGVEYGFQVIHKGRQDGEPLNSDNPPAPPMPGADNLVLQVRRIMQAERDRNRSPVLDPEDLPFSRRYEVDEDDYRFEEEIIAEAQSKASQPTRPSDGEPPQSEATPPQAAAEPPTDGEVEPPLPNLAAE